MRRFYMIYGRFQYGNIIHQPDFAFGKINRKVISRGIVARRYRIIKFYVGWGDVRNPNDTLTFVHYQLLGFVPHPNLRARSQRLSVQHFEVAIKHQEAVG